MYTLSDTAINRIKESPDLRASLETALRCSPQSIYRFYTDNEVNGPLTKYAVLEAISEETGLEIKEILVKVKVKVIAK